MNDILESFAPKFLHNLLYEQLLCSVILKEWHNQCFYPCNQSTPLLLAMHSNGQPGKIFTVIYFVFNCNDTSWNNAAYTQLKECGYMKPRPPSNVVSVLLLAAYFWSEHLRPIPMPGLNMAVDGSYFIFQSKSNVSLTSSMFNKVACSLWFLSQSLR